MGLTTVGLQVEMMYLFFLLFLLGHRVEGQDETCWHDPCDPKDIEGKLIKKVKATDVGDCQEQCKNSAEADTCVWFDFGGLNHGEENCVLLKEICDQQTYGHSDGISGPPNCGSDPTPTCEFHQGVQGALQWQCFDEFGDVFEDSKKKLPLRSSCTTECYGNRYTSKCVKDGKEGKWEALESTADGDDQAHIAKIKTPDLEGDDQGKCECDPITLKKKDPNLEPGAIFHCSAYSKFCDEEQIEITEGGCTLMCDGYQYVSFHCIDGAWYKDDESKPMEDAEIDTFGDDLYCYNEERVKCPKK